MARTRVKLIIATAAVHRACFYCYDDNDPDVIVAFQLSTDRAGVDDFGEATLVPRL